MYYDTRAWRYFKVDMSLDAGKNLFRELAKKLHPDMGGDAKDFREMNDEFAEFVKYRMSHAFEEAGEEKTKGQSVHAFEEILAKIIHMNMRIEIIGYWIYCFDSYEYRAELAKLGFWFAQSKKAWVYSGGQKKRAFPRFKTVEDAKKVYGSEMVRDLEKVKAINSK